MDSFMEKLNMMKIDVVTRIKAHNQMTPSCEIDVRNRNDCSFGLSICFGIVEAETLLFRPKIEIGGGTLATMRTTLIIKD
ncbi:hypothetical protein CTI12_AA195120 [Artemisia annua]|uniref:Uncharacterized protein n=1 Tax=Artemisia annua TaxID=35608 RepID=A0A2U1P492_ARTAN|nr:hypothetical protein CTI12_AA195120 [Artemisia annua]